MIPIASTLWNGEIKIGSVRIGQIVGASNMTRPQSHFSGCDEADLIDTFGSQNVEAVPAHGRSGLRNA